MYSRNSYLEEEKLVLVVSLMSGRSDTDTMIAYSICKYPAQQYIYIPAEPATLYLRL